MVIAGGKIVTSKAAKRLHQSSARNAAEGGMTRGNRR